MDYSLITQEELTKRLRSLSESEKAVLISEEVNNVLEDIASAYDFDEEESEMLKQIVSLVILKIIPKSEFKQELKENIEIDDGIAEFIYEAIQENIFALSDIGELPKTPLSPTFAPGQSAYVPSAPVFAPSNNRISQPNKIVESAPLGATGNKISSPAPFIIHERSDVKAASAPIQSFGTFKQTYIKPQFTPIGGSPPPAARVQFGEQAVPKVINYSTPSVQNVKPKTTLPSKPDETKEDPSNIINLRDLPK